MGALADIVQQFMAMVRAERQPPPWVTSCLPALLFAQQMQHHGHHVGIPAKVIRLHERPVRVLAHVAQMHECDPVSKCPRDLGHVVMCARTQGTGAQGQSVGDGWHGIEDETDIFGGGADARQTQQRARWVIGVDAQTHAGFLGGWHHRTQERGEVQAQLRMVDVAVAVQHPAQTGDIVPVERTGQAGHDAGQQTGQIRFAGGIVPGTRLGQNGLCVIGFGAGAAQHVALEGRKFMRVEA